MRQLAITGSRLYGRSAFVNCIPYPYVRIKMSRNALEMLAFPDWNDIKSQIGSTIIHRTYGNAGAWSQSY